MVHCSWSDYLSLPVAKTEAILERFSKQMGAPERN